MRRLSRVVFCSLGIFPLLFKAPIVSDVSADGVDAALCTERAWEVYNKACDSIVPDIFYADDVQTEQLMPTETAFGRKQIDQLIYPTLGNPNLVVVDSEKSTLDFVLRLESNALASLELDRRNNTSNPRWTDISFKQDAQNYLAFYLISRKDRALGESKTSIANGGIRIQYTDLATGAIRPGFALQLHRGFNQYPQALRSRQTVHFSADANQLVQVPDGLYDVRFELVVGGKLVAREFQYNAARVFQKGPSQDQYTALNVTDSQVSISDILEQIIPGSDLDKKSFREISLHKLQQFVEYVNTTQDQRIQKSAFITFNGDLHNGGSPASLATRVVSRTYLEESRAILNTLKELNYPIFLLPGNHDGYVATGQRPSAVAQLERSQKKPDLKDVVKEASAEAGKNFSDEEWGAYENYLRATESRPGGNHADIFQGRYVRRAGIQSLEDWQDVSSQPVANRVLYDGFNHWRKNYGPLYYTFSFGANRYIALNTYDLRQHRRTGWGMYTVNYGGGMSPFQMDWFRQQLERADARGEDIIVMAHHDPRGGHKGEDFPYYYKQIEYEGMSDSFTNYVKGEVLNPVICAKVPDFLKSKNKMLSCLHDGLQEWMLADDEFDCDNADLKKTSDPDGARRCDTDLFKPTETGKMKKHAMYSGYQFIDKLSTIKNFRTLLLGHTHYHSVEILKGGDELIPDHVILSAEMQNTYKEIESQNPMRLFSRLVRASSEKKPEFTDKALENRGIYRTVVAESENLGKVVELVFGKASNQTFKRVIEGNPEERELAVLRLTSVANMTSQKYKGDPMFGFSVLGIEDRADQRGYRSAQVNHIYYYQNVIEKKSGERFSQVAELRLDRTQRAQLIKGQGLLDRIFTME